MKVACTTTYDPHNPRAFGGRGYYMIRAVAAYTDMAYLGPLTVEPQPWQVRARAAYYDRFTRKAFTPDRDRLVVEAYGRQLTNKLRQSPADLVFSPMSPGSQPVAYLETDRPIVIWTDATLAAAIRLYPELGPGSFSRTSRVDGLANERAALDRASLLIYSSEWAAQSAIDTYQLDPARVRVLPFGANLDDEFGCEKIQSFIAARSTEVCKLLFISSWWLRKGGNIALETARRLNERGLRTELIVVGGPPAIPEPYPDFVKPMGFLNKSDPLGKAVLYQLLAESHFLMMPTRADCTPFVFSEACAFGLPCISTDVGGVSSVIRDGVNGRVFPLDAQIDAYVDYIADTFSDAAGYRRLAASAYQEYATRLSWDVSGRKIRTWFEELLAS